MSSSQLFVTGIGTDVGKTVVSAVLTKALEADYWKPVQCGDLDNSDSIKIARLTGLKIHPEAYALKAPMSPHGAAELENVELDLNQIQLPKTENHLVVEGAGGMMVPINYSDSYLGLMKKLQLPVILVTRHYLGSINHTMLSWEMCKSAGLNVKALIISGKKHEPTERYFESQINVPFIRLSELKEINAKSISGEAKRLKEEIQSIFR